MKKYCHTNINNNNIKTKTTMETNNKIYLVVWENNYDGELDVKTKAFWTLDNARKYLKETIIPRLQKSWDMSDAQMYNMNDEYEEGATIVESGDDFISIYENGNACLYRDDAYIRELVVE